MIGLAVNGIKSLFGGKTALILGVALLAIAGGAYAYHQVVVSNLETTVADLRTDVVTLKENEEKITAANISLQRDVNDIKRQSEGIVKLMNEMRAQDAEISSWFDEARSTLLQGDELAKRYAADPQGTIDLINRDIACTISNMGTRGVCRDGVFVPGATK